jgi:hypothetical protein
MSPMDDEDMPTILYIALNSAMVSAVNLASLLGFGTLTAVSGSRETEGSPRDAAEGVAARARASATSKGFPEDAFPLASVLNFSLLRASAEALQLFSVPSPWSMRSLSFDSPWYQPRCLRPVPRLVPPSPILPQMPR